MKKKAIRLFALMLTMMLVLPLLTQPAFAADQEVADYQGMPIFAVGLANSEGKISNIFLSAYLAHDPETDATFLLASSVLDELVKEKGYIPLILGDDGYLQTAEVLATGGIYAFLYAPGLENAPSLTLAESAQNETAIVYREFTAEQGLSDLIQVDCDLSSGWEISGAAVYENHKLENWAMLGAPMIVREDGTVLGGITINNDSEIVLMPTSRGKLPTEYSLEAVSGGSAQESRTSETQPAGTEPAQTKPAGSQPSGGSSSRSGKNSNYIWIGVVLAAAAAFWYYRRQNEAKKAQQAQQEGTIAFDKPFPAEDSQMRPGVPDAYTTTIPMSQYLLRCVSGPLAGQTFPINGELTIGRSSGCSIVLPNETPGVSSSHCAVTLEHEGVALRDLASTYGTFLGADRRLEPHKNYTLKPGDTFTLAGSGPAFRLEGQGAQESGPAVRDMAGRVYRADEAGRITFGRTGGNQIRVADESISSSHCVLYRDGGQLYLKDLSSTNGTFFSQRQRLKPDTPYRIRRGMAFFLSNPNHTFVVVEE